MRNRGVSLITESRVASLEPMRRVDAAWFGMDRPRNTADIVSLMKFSERVTYSRIRAMVSERLLANPRFRQRVRTANPGVPAWEEDPDFDLRRHLLEPRSVGRGRGALAAALGQLASAALDPEHPPWRLEMLESGGETALALKVHHCVGDGRALVRVLGTIADEGVPEPAAPGRAFRPLALVEGGLVAALRAVRDPRTALRLAGEAMAFGSSLARLTVLPPDRPPALAPKLSGVRRVAWTQAVPMEAVRAACKRLGATLNEVVLAAIAGALRAVLARAGEPVDALAPRALMPVDARDPADRSASGNAFGLVFFEVPVRGASPEERLAMVRARSAALRKSPDAMVTLAVLGAMGLLPEGLEELATGFFSRKGSMVITNVRGPGAPVHLAGSPLSELVFWVPHPATLGLGISIISYAEELRVGVRADTAVFADPEPLASGITAELATLGVEVPRAAPEQAPERRVRRVRITPRPTLREAHAPA